jgi:hypothetical protein
VIHDFIHELGKNPHVANMVVQRAPSGAHMGSRI